MKYFSSLILVFILGACSSGSLKNNRNVASVDFPSPCGYTVTQQQSEYSAVEVERGSFPQLTQDDVLPGMNSSRVQSQALGGVIEISRGGKEEMYSFQVISVAGKTQGSLQKFTDGHRPNIVRGTGALGDFTVHISCN
jgi:hypothetical protein